MKAAEKARRAEQRVAAVRRELVKAEKAQSKADTVYLELLRTSFAREQPTLAPAAQSVLPSN
jgi:hypothetical protein